MRFFVVLFCFTLLAGCRSGLLPEAATGGTSIDAFAVMAEADRLAEQDLWPGFDPRTKPVAIYDGDRTLLFRHPAPPPGFQPVPGRDGVWAYAGRYPRVTANTSTEIGGVLTATLMPTTETVPLIDRASHLIHEIFHIYQQKNHPGWQANEVELFTYPVDDPELLTFRRMETEASRGALMAGRRDQAACWGRTALNIRQERFTRMAAGAVAYERGTEWFEGLAHYVESRARELPDSLILRENEFAPEAVRQRAYATGTAFARLLDRFSPDWRTVLAQNDSIPLDVLLSDLLTTLESSTGECEFTPGERSNISITAMEDIANLRTRLANQRSAFLEQDGWRLIVETTDNPLFPQGFDPLNVQVIHPGEVLHSRWLKLGNAAGTVEILGFSALSEAAGDHPLFNGIRRLTIAGLANQPMVTDANGTVIIQTDGIHIELRSAAVEQAPGTLTIRLPVQ